MMVVQHHRISHFVLGAAQNYQSQKEIFGFTLLNASALTIRVSKIYQNNFKVVIGIVTPNKANQVGRGLTVVVVFTSAARRLFECYVQVYDLSFR